MIKPLPEITAEQENFRLEPFFEGAKIVKRDPVEPVPVGAYVARVFKVTGYDRDCDGSLMARLEAVDKKGEATGWSADGVGLYPDSFVVCENPDDLHQEVEW